MTHKMTPEKIAELGQKVKLDNRRKGWRAFLLSAGILLVIFFFVKWVKGDYKFAFRETAITTGVVIDNRIDIQGWFRDQYVLYEYYADGERFTGISYELFGFRSNGESIKIKYAVSDPEIHEPIEKNE